MSRSLEYIFPEANVTDVCLPQTTVGAANLIINGNLARNDRISFIQYDYSRQLSFAADVDLSGIHFTILGTQNGVSIIEIIDGPNAEIVYSTQIFDTIISITVDAAVTSAVTVGTGYNGFFPLIGIDLEQIVVNYSLSLATLTSLATPTQIFGSISSIVNNGKSYIDNITDNFSMVEIKSLDISSQYLYSNIVHPTYSYLLIGMSGDHADLFNSMQLNFIQPY